MGLETTWIGEHEIPSFMRSVAMESGAKRAFRRILRDLLSPH